MSVAVFRHPNLAKNRPAMYHQYWIKYLLPDQYYEYGQLPQPLDTPRGPTHPNLSFVSSPNLNLKTVTVSFPHVIQYTTSPYLFCW